MEKQMFEALRDHFKKNNEEKPDFISVSWSASGLVRFSYLVGNFVFNSKANLVGELERMTLNCFQVMKNFGYKFVFVGNGSGFLFFEKI